MVYVVKFRIGYYDREFLFENADAAMDFAKVALSHSVDCEDNKKLEAVIVMVKPNEIPGIVDDVKKCGDD